MFGNNDDEHEFYQSSEDYNSAGRSSHHRPMNETPNGGAYGVMSRHHRPNHEEDFRSSSSDGSSQGFLSWGNRSPATSGEGVNTRSGGHPLASSHSSYSSVPQSYSTYYAPHALRQQQQQQQYPSQTTYSHTPQNSRLQQHSGMRPFHHNQQTHSVAHYPHPPAASSSHASPHDPAHIGLTHTPSGPSALSINSSSRQGPTPFRPMPPREYSLGTDLRRTHPVMPPPTLPSNSSLVRGRPASQTPETIDSIDRDQPKPRRINSPLSDGSTANMARGARTLSRDLSYGSRGKNDTQEMLANGLNPGIPIASYPNTLKSPTTPTHAHLSYPPAYSMKYYPNGASPKPYPSPEPTPQPPRLRPEPPPEEDSIERSMSSTPTSEFYGPPITGQLQSLSSPNPSLHQPTTTTTTTTTKPWSAMDGNALYSNTKYNHLTVPQAVGDTPVSVSSLSANERTYQTPSSNNVVTATARFGKLLQECRELTQSCGESTETSQSNSNEDMPPITGNRLVKKSTLGRLDSQETVPMDNTASLRDDDSDERKSGYRNIMGMHSLGLKAAAAAAAATSNAEASRRTFDPVAANKEIDTTTGREYNMSSITMDPLLKASMTSSKWDSSINDPANKSLVSDLSLGVDQMYGDMDDENDVDVKQFIDEIEKGLRTPVDDDTASFAPDKFLHQHLRTSSNSVQDSDSDLLDSLSETETLKPNYSRALPSNDVGNLEARIYQSESEHPEVVNNTPTTSNSVPEHDANVALNTKKNTFDDQGFQKFSVPTKTSESPSKFYSTFLESSDGSHDSSGFSSPKSQPNHQQKDIVLDDEPDLELLRLKTEALQSKYLKEVTDANPKTNPNVRFSASVNGSKSSKSFSSSDFDSECDDGLLVGFGRRRRGGPISSSSTSSSSSSKSAGVKVTRRGEIISSSESSCGFTDSSGSSSSTESSGTKEESGSTSSPSLPNIARDGLNIPTHRDSVSELSFGGASALVGTMSIRESQQQTLKKKEKAPPVLASSPAVTPIGENDIIKEYSPTRDNVHESAQSNGSTSTAKSSGIHKKFHHERLTGSLDGSRKSSDIISLPEHLGDDTSKFFSTRKSEQSGLSSREDAKNAVNTQRSTEPIQERMNSEFADGVNAEKILFPDPTNIVDSARKEISKDDSKQSSEEVDSEPQSGTFPAYNSHTPFRGQPQNDEFTADLIPIPVSPGLDSTKSKSSNVSSKGSSRISNSRKSRVTAESDRQSFPDQCQSRNSLTSGSYRSGAFLRDASIKSGSKSDASHYAASGSKSSSTRSSQRAKGRTASITMSASPGEPPSSKANAFLPPSARYSWERASASSLISGLHSKGLEQQPENNEEQSMDSMMSTGENKQQLQQQFYNVEETPRNKFGERRIADRSISSHDKISTSSTKSSLHLRSKITSSGKPKGIDISSNSSKMSDLSDHSREGNERLNSKRYSRPSSIQQRILEKQNSMKTATNAPPPLEDPETSSEISNTQLERRPNVDCDVSDRARQLINEDSNTQGAFTDRVDESESSGLLHDELHPYSSVARHDSMNMISHNERTAEGQLQRCFSNVKPVPDPSEKQSMTSSWFSGEDTSYDKEELYEGFPSRDSDSNLAGRSRNNTSLPMAMADETDSRKPWITTPKQDPKDSIHDTKLSGLIDGQDSSTLSESRNPEPVVTPVSFGDNSSTLSDVKLCEDALKMTSTNGTNSSGSRKSEEDEQFSWEGANGNQRPKREMVGSVTPMHLSHTSNDSSITEWDFSGQTSKKSNFTTDQSSRGVPDETKSISSYHSRDSPSQFASKSLVIEESASLSDNSRSVSALPNNLEAEPRTHGRAPDCHENSIDTDPSPQLVRDDNETVSSCGSGGSNLKAVGAIALTVGASVAQSQLDDTEWKTDDSEENSMLTTQNKADVSPQTVNDGDESLVPKTSHESTLLLSSDGGDIETPPIQIDNEAVSKSSGRSSLAAAANEMTNLIRKSFRSKSKSQLDEDESKEGPNEIKACPKRPLESGAFDEESNDSENDINNMLMKSFRKRSDMPIQCESFSTSEDEDSTKEDLPQIVSKGHDEDSISDVQNAFEGSSESAESAHEASKSFSFVDSDSSSEAHESFLAGYGQAAYGAAHGRTNDKIKVSEEKDSEEGNVKPQNPYLDENSGDVIGYPLNVFPSSSVIEHNDTKNDDESKDKDTAPPPKGIGSPPKPKRKFIGSKLFWISLVVLLGLIGGIVGVVVVTTRRNEEIVIPPATDTPQPSPQPTIATTLTPTSSPTIKVTPKNWVQVGGDLVGESPGDEAGFSVSVSENGSRVVVGARRNSKDGLKNQGSARIFQFDTSTGFYVAIANIYGEAGGDQCGFSVSMSSNGTRVAVGSLGSDRNGQNSGQVRIFDENEDSGSWDLAFDFIGELEGSLFGTSVSLSRDGSTLAVGAPYYSENPAAPKIGRAYVYREIQDSSWELVGEPIPGESGNDLFGWSVSLSPDKNFLAVGAPKLENAPDSGYVKLFFFESNDWTPRGESLSNGIPGDRFGFSVSLAGNETLNAVAVGAPGDGENGEGSGLACIHMNDGIGWSRLGTNILGESWSDNLGYSVALTPDEKRMVVGVPNKKVDGLPVGQVLVVDIRSGNLVTTGSLYGIEGEKFGVSVDVSDEGILVFGGATAANLVRAYA